MIITIDTRFSKDIENLVKTEWDGNVLFSSFDSQSRGVAIFVKRNLPLKILDQFFFFFFFLKPQSHLYSEILKTTKTRRQYDLDLATKAIEGPSLPLQCVHHVHCSNRLPLGMLGVSNSVPNHILEEHLESKVGKEIFT